MWMKSDGEGDTVAIAMNGQQTVITDHHGEGQEKKYTFDYSFWSHDGYKTEDNGYLAVDGLTSKYHDQKFVYDKIGVDVLDNAWQGFHTCLFAYGQTGSGKSYSMTGYGANKGIIPQACQEIYRRIDENSDPDISFEVETQVCEIYNEVVQDLCIDPRKRKQGGLKVRQSKALGVYVEGLSKHPCTSYEEIQKTMDIADNNRTVASTQMNATSSRAHTITQILFTQLVKHAGKVAKKVSMINLIDLAGSEKAS